MFIFFTTQNCSYLPSCRYYIPITTRRIQRKPFDDRTHDRSFLFDVFTCAIQNFGVTNFTQVVILLVKIDEPTNKFIISALEVLKKVTLSDSVIRLAVNADNNEEDEFYDALPEGGGTPGQTTEDHFTLSTRAGHEHGHDHGHRQTSSGSSSETEEPQSTKHVS